MTKQMKSDGLNKNSIEELIKLKKNNKFVKPQKKLS
jgi:hypothetical protein